MKTRHYIIAMMSVVTLTANAQTYTPASANNGAIQSQQIMNSGAAYDGTVYEPFSNTTPSEQTEVGAGYSPAKAPGGPRKTLINGAESGQGPSPIGDAVLPLMLMAMAFAGVVYLRRQKASKH